MSTVSHTSNAGQTTFAIPFEFIAENHLTVSVDDVPIASSGWSLNSVSSLEIVQVLSEGQTVTIERTTPDSLLVEFQAPASLRPRELSLSYKQMIFLLQELKRASGQGLPLSLTGTSWLAGGLPVKNLAAPTDDGDAVTKVFLEGALQATGVLPDTTDLDIGLGLRVRGGGSGTSFQLSPITGQTVEFEVPQASSVGAPPGAQFGHVLKPGGFGVDHVFTHPDERVPIEFVKQTGVPEAGAVAVAANGFDLVLPRGKWRVRVFGSCRSLANGTSSNPTGAITALTNESGATVFSKSPTMSLGISGGASSVSPPTTSSPTFPFLASSFFQLELTETFLVAQTINLRASSGTSASDTVIDYPCRVIVEEIPF